MPTDDLTLRLIRQWYDVNRVVEQALVDVLGEQGLTESTGTALWVIGTSPAPLTLKVLAARLACDPSNATLVANKLEAEGLLERREHPQDRRSRVVALTSRGEKALAHLLAEVTGRTPLRGLTHPQQLSLTAILQSLIEHASPYHRA